MNWDLHRRLVFSILFPLTLISLLLATVFITYQIIQLNESLANRGQSLARHLATASRHALSTNNLPILEPITDSILQESDVTSVTITDNNSTVIMRSHSGENIAIHEHGEQPIFSNSLIFMRPILRTTSAVADVISTQEFEPHEAHLPNIYPEIINPNDIVGWAIVEVTKANTHEKQFSVILNSLGVTGIVLLFSLIIVFRITRNVSSPILQLAYAANEIEKGNLDVQVNTNAKGEFSKLERSINRMAKSLRASRDQLQEQVDQATSDLLTSIQVVERQNKELNEARQQALLASRVKSEFLANMSHEIRTPMNGIVGFLKLLKKTASSQEQHDYIRTIETSSTNLLTIINDILDFSKIEAGKVTLDSIDFNLRENIEETSALLAPSAYDKNINLVSIIYNDVPLMLRGDCAKLRQILTNLVSNAIKFTEIGDVVIRTMLEDETDEQVKIKIMVSDTGIGIKQQDQHRLFSTFEQVDNSTTRKYGGTGLGLAISKSLTEMMGGEIGVESNLNQGSTFWFTLMLDKNMQAELVNETPVSLAGFKVLFYESNNASQLAVKHVMTNWDVDVITVNSISDCFNHIEIAEQNTPFDLVVLGLSHQEVQLHILKGHIDAIKKLTACNLVALVNSADVNLLADIRATGFKYCLSKPLRQREFYQSLCQLLAPDQSLLSLAHTSHNEPPGKPNVPPQAIPSNVSLQNDALKITDGPLSGYRILIAEDQPINSKLMEVILSQAGADTHVVENGKLATQCLAREKFDLVLMDIHMPEMNGVEATQYIRNLDDPLSTIPILALTANAMQEDAAAYMEAGMNDVLIKPVDENQLINKIIQFANISPDNSQPAAPSAKTPSSATPSTKSGQRATKSYINLNEYKNRLAMSKEELTQEIFDMFIKELPVAKAAIMQAYESGDYDALGHHVHKLHGATAYCEAKQLRNAVAALDQAVKTRQLDNLGEKIAQMEKEIDSVIAQSAQTE